MVQLHSSSSEVTSSSDNSRVNMNKFAETPTNAFEAGEFFVGAISNFSTEDQSFHVVVNQDSVQLPHDVEDLPELFWIPMVNRLIYSIFSDKIWLFVIIFHFL